MVSGFTKFKERFQGFENQYVIIGGTACDLIMENEELPFRATNLPKHLSGYYLLKIYHKLPMEEI